MIIYTGNLSLFLQKQLRIKIDNVYRTAETKLYCPKHTGIVNCPVKFFVMKVK